MAESKGKGAILAPFNTKRYLEGTVMDFIADAVIYETCKLQQLLIELKLYQADESKAQALRDQLEVVRWKLESYLVMMDR